MRLIDINKEQLNGYLAKQKQSQFLQSFEWGEFQEVAGNKVFRFGIEEEGVLVGVITLISKRLFLGLGYFYAPRVSVECRMSNVESLIIEIKKIAKKEKCIFLRYEPLCNKNIRHSTFDIRHSLDVQPRKTLILNIGNSEEEILKQMYPKTRYNIRLAEKKGVEIREGGKEDFEEFWKIMQETKERDGFRLHDREYYWKMLFNVQYSILNNHSITNNNSISNIQYSISGLSIKLFIVKYQNKIIAGNIVAFFGDTATYVHGASSNEHRNLMATYALQWQSIREAKVRGCRYYDFFGIDENKWPGVTRFKKGFGGNEVDYPGTFDAVFDSLLYKMYNWLRWVRRKIK